MNTSVYFYFLVGAFLNVVANSYKITSNEVELPEGHSGNDLPTTNNSELMPSLSRREKHTGVTDLNMFDITKSVQRFIRKMTCEDVRVHLGTKVDCNIFKSTPLSQMRLHLAHSSMSDLTVVYPDGHINNPDGFSDAIAAVDPLPGMSFGHPVLLFHVFKMKSKSDCKQQNGKPFKDRKYCLIASKRTQEDCQNTQGCETLFLPLVYSAFDAHRTGVRKQLLKCIHVMKFGPCGDQYLPIQLSPPVSEPCHVDTNSVDCNQLPADEPISCEAGSQCDHAMTFFGGWNDLAAQPTHELSLFHIHDLLQRSGFAAENIKVFFNSTITIDMPYVHQLATVRKPDVRKHLRKVCTSPCVDSFVVYLNGPTLSDGSMLFYDSNHNGEADVNERYSPDEFLDDLQNCMANHIFLIIDQSHAGKMKESFEKRALPFKYSLLSVGHDRTYNYAHLLPREWSKAKPYNSFSWFHQAVTIEGQSIVETEISDRGDHAKLFTISGVPTQLPQHQIVERLGCSATDLHQN